MKVASVQEIKQELNELNKPELLALCLRLTKYKKDNKELLNFLLFNAHDIDAYINTVNEEIEEMFTEVNSSHVYFAKKPCVKFCDLPINTFNMQAINKLKLKC
jgi:hypothetical protein